MTKEQLLRECSKFPVFVKNFQPEDANNEVFYTKSKQTLYSVGDALEKALRAEK